ncbi:hypothetical protein MTO96_029496 [Rhipicephalus appendiculatus]
MAVPACFAEAFVLLAAIARQHRGRKELDDVLGLPASERVRRHLDRIARRKKGAAVVRRSGRGRRATDAAVCGACGCCAAGTASRFSRLAAFKPLREAGETCHHATRGEQTVRDVVADVIVRVGIRKWFHFPWTPDEKGAFKNVSSAAGDIGCVDGSVAVIIAPKGDHHKAASYCCKKHYADIVMLVCDVDMGICREPLRLGSADDACVWRTTRLRERFEGGHGLQRPYLLGDRGYVPGPWLLTPLQGRPL